MRGCLFVLFLPVIVPFYFIGGVLKVLAWMLGAGRCRRRRVYRDVHYWW